MFGFFRKRRRVARSYSDCLFGGLLRDPRALGKRECFFFSVLVTASGGKLLDQFGSFRKKDGRIDGGGGGNGLFVHEIRRR